MRSVFELVLVLLMLVYAGRLRAQDTTVSRFGKSDYLTADPTGLVREYVSPPGPRYPRSMEESRIRGSSVLVYVIDTTGMVAVETATFLNDVPKEFMSAVCDFLPKLRFKPFVLADMKWRVLLVDMYSFNWLMPDTTHLNAAIRLQKQKQEEFATEPIEKVLASLNNHPHCGRPAGAGAAAKN
jgi:hypothetical protein